MTWVHWIFVGGGALVLIGAVVLWRTSDWDLKGAAIESLWTLLRRKRTAENLTALEKRLREIAAEATLSRKARRTAITAGRHFVAQAAGVAAIAMIAIGVILMAIASWAL